MSYQSGARYAGDMLSADAYGILAGDATSTLIDVRTQAEWDYVGVPDLSSLGKTALFLEWQTFPSMQVDERFVARLSTAGNRRGQARSAARLHLSLGRPLAPCRDSDDRRGLGAVLQCLGRFRRSSGSLAPQERHWWMEGGRTAWAQT